MADIEHVIVLALENRSFDHMLGYLEHPRPEAFNGLVKGGPHTNSGWAGAGPVETSPTAKRVLPVDPDHSHDAVMQQLAVQGTGADRKATNQGFVVSYERKCRGLVPPRFEGLFGPLINVAIGLTGRVKSLFDPGKVVNRGPLIMQCQNPDNVPVIKKLALEFAVCSRWFCSVPGETWPNRNFMHAATSDGETGIDLRLYDDPTIFELLQKNGKTWRVYHDDMPQVWAFHNLWDTREQHAKWFPLDEFAEHVASGKLPNYSFIEPNHRPPLHTLDRAPVVGRPSISNSQHPGNNTVSNPRYDDFPDDEDTDFARAESLIATIYEALRAKPEVFDKSLLLITYDEHGGFYDHVPPPAGVPAPGDPLSLSGRFLHRLRRRKAAAFDFTMLGPRVPAIVVSPYIPAGTVDAKDRDHAAIPATLRAIFMPEDKPLTRRDAWAPPFHTTLTLDRPRRDLPDLSEYAAAPRVASVLQGAIKEEATAEPLPPGTATVYDSDFVAQADLVQQKLTDVAEPEVTDLPAAATTAPVQQATDVTQAFMEAAHRHREELD